MFDEDLFENNEVDKLSGDNAINEEQTADDLPVVNNIDEENSAEINEDILSEPIEETNTIDSLENNVNDLESINLEIPVPTTDKKNRKGLAVFILLILAALIITAFTTIGYLAGKNTFSGNTSGLTPKPTDTEQYSTEQVYEVVNKSVVGIAVYDEKGVQGYASGVIYSEDGYIITNDHIYDEVPAAKFMIYTYDGSTYKASYVAGDTRSDLAVLKIDSSGFYPATFGNSDELKYGEQVVAIGRPNDATSSSSITGGYISFLNRRVSNTTSYASRLIQTDSAINPGSSGGALVNMYGQVIGITSSKLVGNEYEGVGYAIPTTTVKFVVDELIEHGSVVSRAKLGVSYTEIDAVTAEVNGTGITGLLLAEVNEGSPLYEKASVDDIITKVNGIEITKGDIILDIIEASKPGDKLELTVYISKSRTYKTFEITLIQAESTSSYQSELTKDPQTSGGGGTFDFPYGY